MNGLRLFPEGASTISRTVDALYLSLSAGTVVIVTAIFLCILFFAIRYRRRPGNLIGQPEGGSTLLVELTWTILPLFVLMGVFGWAAKIYITEAAVPRNSIDIYVVGKQWMWKLQHPRGNREINELHVPVGQPVRLVMTSEDVIHSFFIPAFRVKHDVLPGRYTQIWFEATKTGRFPIKCAEYCGTDHSRMRGWVYVMEPEDYQQWLSGAATGVTMSQAGEQLFHRLGCAECHVRDAPPLQGLYGKRVRLSTGAVITADNRYIRESILNPVTMIVDGYEPRMPTFAGQVSEEEVLQLIAYIRSLQDVPRGSLDDDSVRRNESTNPTATRSTP